MKYWICIFCLAVLPSCEPDDELDPEVIIKVPEITLNVPAAGVDAEESMWTQTLHRMQLPVQSAATILSRINESGKLSSEKFELVIEGGSVTGSLQSVVGDRRYKKQLVLCNGKTPYLVVKWGGDFMAIERDFSYSPIGEKEQDLVGRVSDSGEGATFQFTGVPQLVSDLVISDPIDGGPHLIESISYSADLNGFWLSKVSAWESRARDESNIENPVIVDSSVYGYYENEKGGRYVSARRFDSENCAQKMDFESPEFCWSTQVSTSGVELKQDFDVLGLRSDFFQKEALTEKSLEIISQIHAVCL